MSGRPYSRRTEIICFLFTMASMAAIAFGLMFTLRAVAEVGFRDEAIYWGGFFLVGVLSFALSEEWAAVIYAERWRDSGER